MGLMGGTNPKSERDLIDKEVAKEEYLEFALTMNSSNIAKFI